MVSHNLKHWEFNSLIHSIELLIDHVLEENGKIPNALIDDVSYYCYIYF